MGKRVSKNVKCNTMGCTLPYLHAGMHNIIMKTKRRHCTYASIRNSPSLPRKEEKISQDSIRIGLIKSRLFEMRKQLDDLFNMI